MCVIFVETNLKDMKTTLLTLILILTSYFNFAQTAEDEIRSPRLKDGYILFNHDLSYKSGKDDHRFHKIVDSSTFIISEKRNAGDFGVYIKAYNPLHYSIDVTNKLVQDPVDLAVFEALNNIVSFVEEMEDDSVQIQTSQFTNELRALKKRKLHDDIDLERILAVIFEISTNSELTEKEINKRIEKFPEEVRDFLKYAIAEFKVTTKLNELRSLLANNKSAIGESSLGEMTESFQSLINMKFESRELTVENLIVIEEFIEKIEKSNFQIAENIKRFYEIEKELTFNQSLSEKQSVDLFFLVNQSKFISI
mgnify:CR=1 FL=1